MLTLLAGLQNPPADEFTKNPDSHTISAFFLGWVFFYSISYFTQSCVTLFRRRLQYQNFPERQSWSASQEKGRPPSRSSDVIVRGKSFHHLFVVVLCLCFASAALFHFISLLAFNESSGYGCSFTTAAAGTAEGLARAVALLGLFLNLKAYETHSVRNGSFFLGCISIFCMIGLIFATNAVGTGVLQSIRQLGIHLCYRRHFVPTSLPASLVSILLALYIIARWIWILYPSFMSFHHRAEALVDIRIGRPISLIFLEVLSIPSNVLVESSLLLQFIPFSVCAVVVLYLFSFESSSADDVVINSIPASIKTASALPSPSPPQPILNQPIVAHSLRHHPYGASSLDKSDRTKTARSSRTVDTDYALSVNNATVQIALRHPLLCTIPDITHLELTPTPSNSDEYDRHNQWSSTLSRYPSSAAPPLPSPTPSRATERYRRALSTLLKARSPSLRSAQTESPPLSAAYGSDIIRRSSSKPAIRNLMRPTSGVSLDTRSSITYPSTVHVASPGQVSRQVSMVSTRHQSSTFGPIPSMPEVAVVRMNSYRQGVQKDGKRGIIRGPRPQPLQLVSSNFDR